MASAPTSTIASTPEAKGVPEEHWVRVLLAFQRWCAAHPVFIARLRRVVLVCSVVALPLLLLAIVVIPRFGQSLVPAVFMTLNLAIVTLLARSRTIAWRTVSLVYGLGVGWSMLVALATVGVAKLNRMDASWDGTSIALASFVEEPGKLLPIVALAVLAPGRVRRFAAVDWALVGFASGAAFTVAEDGIRRLARRPGLLDALFPDKGLAYGLNPWTSGMFTDPLYGLAVAAGHHVWTSNITMAVGLGIALWRSGGGRRWWRPLAVVLPLVVAAMALSDHAAYNAHVALGGWPGNARQGFPGWMQALWTATGYGRLAIVLGPVLLVVCLAVDASRRHASGRLGVVVPEAPVVRVPAPVARLPRWLRPAASGLVLAAGFAWSDVAVWLTAHAVLPGMPRALAAANGRRAGWLIRQTRGDAMAASAPGREPAARRLFGVLALVLGVGSVLVAVGYGSFVARDIGQMLMFNGDHPRFFAGLLEALGRWWGDLGLGGQILVTGLLVVGVMALGGSFALALGLSGIATWVAAHGAGLGALVRDPNAAVQDYLDNATPGQFLRDALDFGLTFVPGAVLGKLLHGPLGALTGRLWVERVVRSFPQHTIDDLTGLFAEREAALVARDAALDKLTALLPDGKTLSDFTKANVAGTMRSLDKAGILSDADLDALRQAADTLTEARATVTRVGERIGEAGGEATIQALGYRIPPEFKATVVAGPGAGHIDGLAVKGTDVLVAEFKGGTAQLSTKPIQTTFEGLATQGTAPYVRELLLRDPRVAQFFANNPTIWKAVTEGRMTISSLVIQTKGVDNIVANPLPIELTPQVQEALQSAINKLLGVP